MASTMLQTSAGSVFRVVVQNTGELYTNDDIKSTDRLENRDTTSVTNADNQQKANTVVMLALPGVGLNDRTDALCPQSD